MGRDRELISTLSARAASFPDINSNYKYKSTARCGPVPGGGGAIHWPSQHVIGGAASSCGGGRAAGACGGSGLRRRRAAGASGSGVRGVCVRRRGTEGLCDKGVCRGRVARASAEAGRDEACLRCGAIITASALPTMGSKWGLARGFACGTVYRAVSHAWRDRPAPAASAGPR